MPHDRGHVDDAPAALLEHRPQGGLRAVVHAGEVGGEDRVPLLRLHAQEQVVAGDARVVHQAVDAAACRPAPRPSKAVWTDSRRATSRANGGGAVRPRPRSARRPPPAWSRRAHPGPRRRPAAASAFAMARPMPREAPVTSTTLPGQGHPLTLPARALTVASRLAGVLDAQDAHRLVDLLDEAGEHGCRVRPRRTCPPLRAPAAPRDSCQRTGRRDLPHQAVAAAVGRAHYRRVHVVHEGHGRDA